MKKSERNYIWHNETREGTDKSKEREEGLKWSNRLIKVKCTLILSVHSDLFHFDWCYATQP